MIKIIIPRRCERELKYIIDIIFAEYLGIDYALEFHEIDNLVIKNDLSLGSLTFDLSFFCEADRNWLKSSSFPSMPLEVLNLNLHNFDSDIAISKIPVLYGKPQISYEGNDFYCGVDIFGSIFFMLTRYEELLNLKRDNHLRFSAVDSIAYKENFLHRPIVDEYVEILWHLLSLKWGGLKRKLNIYQNFITCDVDWPNDLSYSSLKNLALTIARNIYARNISNAIKVVFKYIQKKIGINVVDDYLESLYWIMDVNEINGNRVAFFFIPLNTSKFDPPNSFQDNATRKLLRDIYARGHEIGVHPGYETFNNDQLFQQSIEKFKNILLSEGISQNTIGVRQHFLRWEVSSTPQLQEKYALNYDSSLAFADKPGFRCGTSMEFTMYDLVNRVPLKLKQRPLIIMESTIIAKRYENMGYKSSAHNLFLYYKNTTKLFNGCFTLLWHNSHFENKKDKFFYLSLISK
jgi:hypothetical protein